MTLLQKWIGGLIALGAGYLVFTNANSFYTAAKGIRSVTAGSIADVTTGGKARTQY
jgi:hypothetical protein